MQINYLQDIMPSKWLAIKDDFINEEWQFLNDCALRSIVCGMKLNNVEITCTGEGKNSKTAVLKLGFIALPEIVSFILSMLHEQLY